MKFALITLAIAMLGTIHNTFSGTPIQQDTVYSSNDVDVLPNPEKGLKDVYKQFNRNFRYPADARRFGIEGTIKVSFMVDRNGQVTDITVVEGLGYGTEDAALDAFKKIKIKWAPGKKDNKQVNVIMILSFELKLA